MRLYKAKNYDEMGHIGANIMAAEILLRPDSLISLASGSTPLSLYKNLIEKYKVGDISFEDVKVVNLDEYAGIEPTHEQSYDYFLRQNFLNHVNVKEENIKLASGLAEDLDAEGMKYDQYIADMGGIDLQLLGIGHNGHFAFNEPADFFIKHTHGVDLTEETINANKRFFSSIEEVPTRAFSIGTTSVFSAKLVLMLISGKDKAEILKKALYGPITPRVPASLFQLHSNFIVVADSDALSLLE